MEMNDLEEQVQPQVFASINNLSEHNLSDYTDLYGAKLFDGSKTNLYLQTLFRLVFRYKIIFTLVFWPHSRNISRLFFDIGICFKSFFS
jgi:hypothetical protein